jgi:hypothetical protein
LKMSTRRGGRILSGERLREFVDGTSSPQGSEEAVSTLVERLGTSHGDARVLRAMAACMLGALPEEAAALLDWREFESFSASLLRAKGYQVEENVVLTKPRMQLDLLARSGSIAIAVDCKHWARAGGGGLMAGVVRAQVARVQSLRTRRPELEPTTVIILVMTSGRERFVDGAAIVPVQSLFDFLDRLDSFRGMLSFY